MIRYLFLFLFFAQSFLHADDCVELNTFEHSLYSQNGEDGILTKIFQLIPPNSKYCVDIGAGDGITNSNTYLLRLQGWDCLLLDRAYEIPAYNLYKEFVTAKNINQFFDKYLVPFQFDLLSIDIDYNDFYIWNALDAKYMPVVVVINYNATLGLSEDAVVKYHPFYCGDGTDYFSASITAFANLGRSKGYSLVYADVSGNNLFFIRNDILQEKNLVFPHTNDVEKLYHPRLDNLRRDEKLRPYTTSETEIKP
jgi:hypothetical protein